jgi:hypothetical protein
VKKPTIKMKCPEKNIVYTFVFRETMPIVWLGLLLISRLLHFTDNITADVNDFKKFQVFIVCTVHSIQNVLDLESISVRYVNPIPGIV